MQKDTLLAINCGSKPQPENKSWENWRAEESFPPQPYVLFIKTVTWLGPSILKKF